MPDWWATSDALRDVLVETGHMPPPQRTFDLEEIRPGWLVYDSERERIGRIDGLIDSYLIVRRSFGRIYLWLRLYIPATALGEAHEGSVILNVPRRWIGEMGWGRPPRRPPGSAKKPPPHLPAARRPHFSRHRA
jgi:hypothetical protein